MRLPAAVVQAARCGRRSRQPQHGLHRCSRWRNRREWTQLGRQGNNQGRCPPEHGGQDGSGGWSALPQVRGMSMEASENWLCINALHATAYLQWTFFLHACMHACVRDARTALIQHISTLICNASLIQSWLVCGLQGMERLPAYPAGHATARFCRGCCRSCGGG